MIRIRPEQDAVISEKEMSFIQKEGSGMAFAIDSIRANQEFKEVVGGVVYRRYRRLKILQATYPNLLPEWMRRRDEKGSIMVYPGSPAEPGLAINGRHIEKVPSIWGSGTEKVRLTEPEELGSAFQKMSNYWKDIVPRTMKPKKNLLQLGTG